MRVIRLEALERLDQSSFFNWIRKCGKFSALEVELVFFLARNKKNLSPAVLMTVLFLIYLNSRGFVNLNLQYWSEKIFLDKMNSNPILSSDDLSNFGDWSIVFPDLKTWLKILKKNSEDQDFMVYIDYLDEDEEMRGKKNSSQYRLEDIKEGILLVLEKDSLYLIKNYFYETVIIREMKRLAEDVVSSFRFFDGVKKNALSELSINEYEEDEERIDRKEFDLQKLAVLLSQVKKLLILSGGPGTGKTYTIFHIIKSILERGQSYSGSGFRTIKILASTGKAVFRLREALIKNLESFQHGISEKILSHVKEIIDDSSTVDHFLQTDSREIEISSGGKSNRFFDYDTIIVDEASMLSLNLWYQLVIRRLPKTQLILVGDKDQLPPVETGFVFYDLLSQALNYNYKERTLRKALLQTNQEGKEFPSHSFRDSIVFLKKNYRFQKDSEIADFAAAIQSGKKIDLKDLEKWNHPESSFRIVYDYDVATFKIWLKENWLAHYREWFDVIRACSSFDSFILNDLFLRLRKKMILCSHRYGALGLSEINRQIEDLLIDEKIIPYGEDVGKTVMINRNQGNLFNGDVGLVVNHRKDKENKGVTKVFFEGSEEGILYQQLSFYDPYYAISIHKSQGSEFEEIAVVFPNDEELVLDRFSFLSKELLYTALTRSKVKATFFVRPQLLEQMLHHSIDRHSQVARKIWGSDITTSKF